MTEAGHGGRAWRLWQGMEAGHGDWRGLKITEAGDGGRPWRLERTEDDGDKAWRSGTVIRKGLRVRRLAGGRCR